MPGSGLCPAPYVVQGSPSPSEGGGMGRGWSQRRSHLVLRFGVIDPTSFLIDVLNDLPVENINDAPVSIHPYPLAGLNLCGGL
jgi:hypothetical protein